MAVLTRNVTTVSEDGGFTMWRIGATPPPAVHDQIPTDAWDDAVPSPVGEVPDGTVDEVKAWVGDDVARAGAALITESAGANRSTLVSWLEAVADGSE